jgi:hypothetical protein
MCADGRRRRLVDDLSSMCFGGGEIAAEGCGAGSGEFRMAPIENMNYLININRFLHYIVVC